MREKIQDKGKKNYIHKLKNKQTKRNLLLWINKKFDITKECRCCGEKRGGVGESWVNTALTANVRRQKIWGNN